MKNIIVILLCCVIFASCEDSANKQQPSSKYEEKKASIADMERDSPLKFLKVSGSHRNNIINQTIVEGDITNKATLTTYKNIKVQLNFLDKEGKSIEKQKHNIDDEIKPGATTDFKIKAKHVKEATSVSIDIVEATADK